MSQIQQRCNSLDAWVQSCLENPISREGAECLSKFLNVQDGDLNKSQYTSLSTMMGSTFRHSFSAAGDHSDDDEDLPTRQSNRSTTVASAIGSLVASNKKKSELQKKAQKSRSHSTAGGGGLAGIFKRDT